jgi:3-deoxy-D-manno-octulosonate 8-phosphate phosphatase (KDO 8-P phosphatase)
MIQLKHEWISQIQLLLFDFDGVFTDNRVWVFEDGREAVYCSRADGLGLAKLRKHGLEMGIVSNEKNPVVAARARKLELNCWQGVDDKLDHLRTLAEDRNIAFTNIAFVGNDINDRKCLEAVGLPLVVADAYPEILTLGKAVTSRNGGEGAVREICDAWDLVIANGN